MTISWIGYKGLDDTRRHLKVASEVTLAADTPRWWQIGDSVGMIAVVGVYYKDGDRHAGILCSAADVLSFEDFEEAKKWAGGWHLEGIPILAPGPWGPVPDSYSDLKLLESKYVVPSAPKAGT